MYLMQPTPWRLNMGRLNLKVVPSSRAMYSVQSTGLPRKVFLWRRMVFSRSRPWYVWKVIMSDFSAFRSQFCKLMDPSRQEVCKTRVG
jgi:hypothetical protein